jgi:hypothetical protein
MQFRRAAWTGSKDMQQGYAARICSRTFNIDMQHGNEAWQAVQQHGYAALTLSMNVA